MTKAEGLRLLLKRKPFVPFTIQLRDGKKLRVSHKDTVFLPPKWTQLIVTGPRYKLDFILLSDVVNIDPRAKSLIDGISA